MRWKCGKLGRRQEQDQFLRRMPKGSTTKRSSSTLLAPASNGVPIVMTGWLATRSLARSPSAVWGRCGRHGITLLASFGFCGRRRGRHIVYIDSPVGERKTARRRHTTALPATPNCLSQAASTASRSTCRPLPILCGLPQVRPQHQPGRRTRTSHPCEADYLPRPGPSLPPSPIRHQQRAGRRSCAGVNTAQQRMRYGPRDDGSRDADVDTALRRGAETPE